MNIKINDTRIDDYSLSQWREACEAAERKVVVLQEALDYERIGHEDQVRSLNAQIARVIRERSSGEFEKQRARAEVAEAAHEETRVVLRREVDKQVERADAFESQVKALTEKIYTSEDFSDAIALSKPGRLLPLDNDGNLGAQGVTVLVHAVCVLAATVKEMDRAYCQGYEAGRLSIIAEVKP